MGAGGPKYDNRWGVLGIELQISHYFVGHSPADSQ